jgi:YVTN family beta-propeller protein
MRHVIRQASVGAVLAIAAIQLARPAAAAPVQTGLGRVVADISVGDGVPGFIFDGAFGAGSLWVSGGGDVISRIDPATNAVVAEIAVGRGFRHEIAIGNGAVWVTNPDDDSVTRIDPASDTVVATIPSGGFDPIGITTTPGAVWVANHHADPDDPDSTGSVARIDPTSDSVVALIPVGAPFFEGGPGGMATAGGFVWVGVPNIGGVVAISPATNDVTGYVPVGPCGVPAGDDAALWMPSSGCASPSNAIARIDAVSGRLDFVANPGGMPWFAASGLGSAWASVTSLSCPPKCPPSAGAVVKIDPSSGAVLGRLATHGFGFVAVGVGSVWAGIGETGRVLRIVPR